MTDRIYLDHNASMPLRGEVAAFLGGLGALGNPSSVHAEGRRARYLLETARQQVADWAGVDPAGVIFTSGGTEANALAAHALARRAESEGRARVAWLEAGSHPSVTANVEALLAGWELVRETACPPHVCGCPRAGASCLAASIRFVLAAHNETGELTDLEAAVAAARRDGAFLHVDAVQWPGKMPFHPALRECDAFTLSGHKIGAPMGGGALVLPRPFEVAPMLSGGGQESGRRSGTPSLAAILGFGHALALPFDADHCRRLAVRLRDRLAEGLGSRFAEVSRCDIGLPGTLLAAFPGLPGDVVAAAIDASGVAVSFGSACSSGTPRPSAALLGCGVDYPTACCAVRFSVGPGNTEAEIEEAARRTRVAVECVQNAMGSGAVVRSSDVSATNREEFPDMVLA